MNVARMPDGGKPQRLPTATQRRLDLRGFDPDWIILRTAFISGSRLEDDFVHTSGSGLPTSIDDF